MRKQGAALHVAMLFALLPSSLLFANDGLISTVAGVGQGGSLETGIPAATAQLTSPGGIWVDGSNNLFIADSGNNRVVRLDGVSGLLTVVAGNGTAASSGDGGLATQASLNTPLAVVVDSAGNLYISEVAGRRIRRVSAQTGVISTYAGTGATGFSGDGGPATSGALTPWGLAFDLSGDLYVADMQNNRVREINAQTGIITTVAGNGTAAFTPDGAVATSASLWFPIWVAFDHTGGLLISEMMSMRIRRVDPANGTLSTVAGSGSQTLGGVAFGGDGRPAIDAGIGFPGAMVVDGGGNLFFADGTGRVRRVDATGLIITVAGNGTGPHGPEEASAGVGGAAGGNSGSSGGSAASACTATDSGDGGPATSAVLDAPFGVQLTANGDLLVSDAFDCRVRQVDLPSPNAYTNTTIAANLTILQPGQEVLLTATVSPIGAAGVPTGSVEFVAQMTATPVLLGTAVLKGGIAQLVLNPGSNYGIMAIYSGDSSFNGSGSPELPNFNQAAAKTVATVSLSATPNPVMLGAATVFTATVTPPAGTTTAPTGPVLLYDGSILVSIVNVVNGVATLPDTFNVAGNHSMTATYLGDNNYSQESSAPLTETVAQSVSPSSVTLISSANPSAAGQTLSFTATVSPTTATGTVEFLDGTAAFGTVTIAGGSASLSTSTLALGTHSITAAYGGDANDAPSTSAPLNQTISPAAASVQPQGIITTLAGLPFACAAGVTNCAIGFPVADGAGNIYFLDGYQIVEMNPSGVITAIAGNGASGTSGDGGPALSASLGMVEQIAVHGSQVCFTDYQAHKIRCIDLTTGLIQGYGTGLPQSGGDGGNVSGASFNYPTGIAFDDAGNLYVADFAVGEIRRVDAVTSIITALAFVAYPENLSYYNGGVYAADAYHEAVQRIDLATGTVSPVVAAGAQGYKYLALDQSGDLFFSVAQEIDMMDPSGNVTYVANTLYWTGIGADDIPARQTVFGGIQGLGWDPVAKRLLIADQTRLRQVFFTSSTATSLGVSANPVVPGGQVTLTATVSPGSATGSVRFYNADPLTYTAPIGSVPLSNGTASMTWTAPASGPAYFGMRAVYGGDANDNLSASDTVSVSVQTPGTTATTTSLTASPNPSVFGSPVTFTVSETPSAATGAVLVYNGPNLLGSASLVNGEAQFVSSGLPPGTNQILALYGATSSYVPSGSAVVAQTVNKAPSSLTMTSSANPATCGKSLSFTATMSPLGATGLVRFLDGSVSLGSVVITYGAATLSLTNLPAGTHSITAVYSGDANYLASTSAPLTQTMIQTPSTVVLATSLNPSLAGQTVTLTAMLSPAAATGTVQFLDGASALGTLTISNGSAVLAISTLSPGAHSITAVYSGDSNYLASTSAILTQTVNKAAASVALASSLNPSAFGQSVTLSATVTPATATGTIQYLDGPNALGTISVNNGAATLTLSTWSVGAHSITAVYSGDANDSASTSAAFAQTVSTAPVVMTMTASANPATAGQIITLTATVSPATATGTIQFVQYSPPGVAIWGTVTLSNGTATLTVPGLSPGTYNLGANYSGDANFQSGSAGLTEVVNASTTSVALGSSANPAAYGQPVTFTAVVTPASATGTVRFLDSSTVLGTVTITGGVASLPISTLLAGTHSITAAFSGDTNDGSSASAILAQTINKTVTGVTLVSSLNPSTAGQSVTFTATVSPASATGSIQFVDGTTLSSLGTVTVAGGTAALSLSTLSAVTHSIAAIYSGDANDAASTSAPLTQTVNKIVSSVALASSLNPSTLAQTVTLYAVVTPGTATGGVQFLDGTTVLGTVAVSGGAAALGMTTLSVGAHSITAVYSGDAIDAGSTSAILAQTVNKLASSVMLASSANPSTFGQPGGFTATVSPSTATGTVQILDGSTPLGSVTISSGVATISFSTLSPGAHSITAVYSGDGNDATSTSAVLAQTVNKVVSSVAIGSSLNPSTFGQSVTLTASVTPSSATGSVQFLDGTSVLGTVTISSGTAALAVTSLSVGAHSITAFYSGDGNDATSTSVVLALTVNKVASSVALSSSANPSTHGQSVTFAATVSPSTATGAVQFLDGSTVLGTVTLSGGTAALAVTSLSVGAHSITAVYSGDSNDAASTSAVLAQTVNKVASTVALASSANPSTHGQSVNFTATISPGTATGTVQFLDGSTVLGTVSISGGTAALAVTALSVGAHSITSVYSGDANDAASTSAVLSQTVNKVATSVTVTSTLNPSTLGQTVTFTASIAPSSVTGIVQFLDGSTVLGTVTLSGGTTALSLTTLAAGAHSITAAYGGDAKDAASTSAVLAQTVNKAASSVALASSRNPSASGQSVTFTATVSPSAATGTVQFLDGSTALGTVTLSSGSAAISLTTLTVGSHSIKAVYSGDSNHSGSTSAALTQSVTGAACHVTYAVTTQWNVGFGTAITIENTGTTSVNGWNLTWTWAGNQKITQSWDSTYSQTGANAKLTNASFDSSIAPGATLTGIGFNASYSGTNTAPTAFSLNGTLCK